MWPDTVIVDMSVELQKGASCGDEAQASREGWWHRALGRKEHGLLETQTESLMGVHCEGMREAAHAGLVVTIPAAGLMAW